MWQCLKHSYLVELHLLVSFVCKISTCGNFFRRPISLSLDHTRSQYVTCKFRVSETKPPEKILGLM